MHAISHSLLAYGTLWLSISHEGLSCNQHRKDIPPSPGQWEDLLRTPLWGGSFSSVNSWRKSSVLDTTGASGPFAVLSCHPPAAVAVDRQGSTASAFLKDLLYPGGSVPCLVACSQWLSDVVWKASLWPPSRRCSRQNLLCGVLFMFQSSCRVRLTLDHN